VRLAPEGELYVLESFSVQHATGVTGFPQGKQVTLVREDGGSFVVSDGQIEVSKPKSFFTRDLDVVDGIRNRTSQMVADAESAHKSLVMEQRQASEERVAQRSKEDFEKESTRLKDLLARRKLDLDTLRGRISLARNERSDKGYPSDGGPRHVRDGVARFLSPDAGNIRNLLEARHKLERNIGELELHLQKHLRGASSN
jgi:hypothetical protein